jgi:hypothetical protein
MKPEERHLWEFLLFSVQAEVVEGNAENLLPGLLSRHMICSNYSAVSLNLRMRTSILREACLKKAPWNQCLLAAVTQPK